MKNGIFEVHTLHEESLHPAGNVTGNAPNRRTVSWRADGAFNVEPSYRLVLLCSLDFRTIRSRKHFIRPLLDFSQRILVSLSRLTQMVAFKKITPEDNLLLICWN